MRWLIATCLLGAALVHALAMPGHFDEWAAAGVFFAVLTVAEVALAGAVVGGESRRVAFAVVVLDALTIGVWSASRAVGLPFGPEAGVREAIGGADAVATVFEAVSMLAALALVRPGVRLPRLRPAHHAVGLAATALVLVVTTLVAQPSLAGHGHEGDAHGGGHVEHVHG